MWHHDPTVEGGKKNIQLRNNIFTELENITRHKMSQTWTFFFFKSRGCTIKNVIILFATQMNNNLFFPHVTSGRMPSVSPRCLCHPGLLGTADGVSRSRLGVQSGVSRCGDDQIVTVPLVPLETAPESPPVPTSSSSPAATAAGGSGPDRLADVGQVGQTSPRV